MSDLFDLYLEKIHEKELVITNLGEDWEGKGLWRVLLRNHKNSDKEFCVEHGEGKSPALALKNAYTKIFPVKKRIKKRGKNKRRG